MIILKSKVKCFFCIFVLLNFQLLSQSLLRNPFLFQDKYKSGSHESENINNINYIEVLAISQIGERRGAILKKQEEEIVVFVGDNIWGYIVKDIKFNSVELLGLDKKRFKLLLEF